MNDGRLSQLQTALTRVDELIRVAVVRVQASGQDPNNALRGLVISPDDVETYLDQEVMSGLWSSEHEFNPSELMHLDFEGQPFGHLIEAFDLSPIDSYILLLCLTPDLDHRYERLYAYLQDDVSQRYPTVNLMMNLLGSSVEQRFHVWQRLTADKPLRKHHLIACTQDPSRPNSSFLSYRLKADHRIMAFLLNEQTPDERLWGSVEAFVGHADVDLSDPKFIPIRDAIPYHPLIYMEGKDGMGQAEITYALCQNASLPLVVADIAQLVALDLPFNLAWRLALREGYLQNAPILLNHWDACLNDDKRPPPEFWEAIQAFPYTVFICGIENWEPIDRQRQRRMLRFSLDVPPYPERRYVWERTSRDNTLRIADRELDELANKFRFTATQIERTVQTAVDLAASRGSDVTIQDLYAGAQAHSTLSMGHLAKRIIPRYTWENLILPPDQLSQLQEISSRARFGHLVREEWGFQQKIGNINGVSALFAGDSGTGKTLSAEVIANDLGLVIYKIDLSAVVSKYIGETEKNLGKIFAEARASNAILFFDEADALFGKRSEVKDAKDRYANIEISYLLQEIESYDGIAILATNLRQNLDEAFTRRLDFLIDFPSPEAPYRRLLWEAHFPRQAPLSADIDLDNIAERYTLAGGNIRNAALASAYFAAADGGVITNAHIRNAIRREHQKMGRLLEDEYEAID